MEPVPGKHGIGRDKGTEMGGAHQPFPIEAVVKAFIEPANRLPRFARQEDAWLIQRINNLEQLLARLLQLAAFSFRTIKYWSGFAGDFLSPTSKCSANKSKI